jgi:hypothetical protein
MLPFGVAGEASDLINVKETIDTPCCTKLLLHTASATRPTFEFGAIKPSFRNEIKDQTSSYK